MSVNPVHPADCIGDVFDVMSVRNKIGTDVTKDYASGTHFSHFITDGEDAGKWYGRFQSHGRFKTPEASRYMVIKIEKQTLDPDGDFQGSFAVAAPYTDKGLDADRGQLIRFSLGYVQWRRPEKRDCVTCPLDVPYTTLESHPRIARRDVGAIIARYESFAEAGRQTTRKLIESVAQAVIKLGLPEGAEHRLPEAIRALRKARELRADAAACG